jgi:hypothetical protein
MKQGKDVMNKAESKKEDKVVNDSLEEVEKILHKLLDGQNDKHRMLILEGALHAVIHSLEHEAPSGLYSTHFILDALNSSLEAAMRREMEEMGILSSPDDSGMIH